MSSMQQQNRAVVWSVALHIAVLAGLALGVELPDRPRVAISAAPIQGVIVDTAALRRDQAARDAAARQERQRQQRAEQQRREAAEQQKLAEQREQQRVADAARAREQAAEQERDRAAAAKREQEQQAQLAREQRERDAREKAERDAAAKREREAAAVRERAAAEQRRREAELQAAIELDRERAEAESAGLLDQYMALLEDAIKDEWNRPLSARPGVDCVVQVVQVQTGDVLSARVASCNGDDAVRRSIEKAVMDASPLPRAPDPTLFQRNLNVRFKPDE
jgi:colicin import membrane protein